jgi:hypothetical protein
MANGIQQYVKLENRLVLLAWLNSLLGYESNRKLLEDTQTVAEDFGEDGHSSLYHHLIARGNQVKIPAADLARYDKNIRVHLETINHRRTERITLRYFQYLAALYTEIFLDRLFKHEEHKHEEHKHEEQLLKDLNDFVKERNAPRLPGEPKEAEFTEKDLTKLAYWMATGSGKTLILHLNYHQFLHYNRESPNNILLITPNEGLSEQHLAELAASGIPARRFVPNAGTVRSGGQDVVQVIEITKLVKEKRGSGVSVQVDGFEGRNLIFVDEGHKGSGGEAWRKYRDALGAAGFTFEYSATFGQALSAARNDPLTAEYGKAILFDYSYRYFYGDGFGKDFRILNLKEETQADETDTLLLGNLLSFYEQVRLYGEQADALRPYNLEKPLWVFVGSTVNAVYTENKQPRSDVLTVVRFLHRLLSDRSWTVSTIQSILKGETGLVSPDGQDIFAERFPFLREAGRTDRPSSSVLYDNILKQIFHAPASGGLHLCDIKSSAGELGLKAAGAEDYFGLIYIGDTTAFKQLVETNAPEIALEQDAISSSLFERINRPDSAVHVLIGAKKFMEGWNSWRVASMGLLNIGRQEGAQIIQLFGRGVRLKGKDLSLKRSAALPGDHPKHLRLLETLNIFAVRANYMAQFREYLEREGVETEEYVELRLSIQINSKLLNHNLVVPRPPEGRDFAAEATLLLEPDTDLSVQVDVSVHVQALESGRAGLQSATAQSAQAARPIPPESLAFIDWQQAYLDLLAYKERKGITNLLIRPETLHQIVEQDTVKVVAEDSVLRPQTWTDRARLQEAVTRLLCRYLDKFYQTRREQWDEKTVIYRPLSKEDPNLNFRPQGVSEGEAGYVVRVPRSEQCLIEAVEKLLEEQDLLYQQENAGLPRINFDRHLYQPLLVAMPDKAQMIPPGLQESEARFVQDLRAYWNAEKNKALAGKEVFLLRNQSRGYGIGFFEERGFYPDFILWVVDQSGQRIIFIEPHGMLHAKAYIHDEKARLHERLPKLAQEIAQRSHRQDITLDAFIISATPYNELHKYYDNGKWDRAKFTEKHILFPERNGGYDYMKKLFT